MSILIVEDSNVARSALREMLAEIDGTEIVGEFESPAPAIKSIRANPPSVILLDIQLVNGSGLEVLRVAHLEYPHIKVIVFSNFAEPIYRQRCMDGGAYAFFDKKDGLQPVRQTLQELALTAPRC